MDEKRTLWKAVSSARRSLFFDHLMIGIQKGLFYAVLSITLIFFVTRFFVFPYYTTVAFTMGLLLFVGQLIVTTWKGPSKKQALQALDAFYPHNELVTVLTVKQQSTLINQLTNSAVKLVNEVFRSFQKRPKNIFQRKVMISSCVSFLIFIILFAFPAATQKEAKLIEDEQIIAEELKENIEKQKVEKLPEDAQKKLDELLQAIEEAKTSDEILKELVKAQKELAHMEQQLAAQEQNEHTKAQLSAIQSVTSSLAENSNLAMKRLSEIGKPLDLTMQRTIGNMNKDPNSLAASNGSNTSNQQGGNSNQQGGSNSNQQSNQNGQSNGQGQSQGQGQGQGPGQGQGQGQTGGLQGGVGSGGRELIAVPERIGQAGDPTIDSGTTNDGETITEKGPVPTTKGTIRAYEDVIGSYKDSYRESTDRLQLPSDLQKMVQSYFTSIE